MADHDTNAHKYRLKVTAGPVYDRNTHQVVPVNGETIRIENEHAIVSLCVRIQDYAGKIRALRLFMQFWRAKRWQSSPITQGIPRNHLQQARILNMSCTKRICTPYVSR